LPSNHLFDTDEGEENHREVVFQAGLEGFTDETDVVVNLVFGDIQQLGDLLVFPVFRNGTPILAVGRDDVKQLGDFWLLFGVQEH